ncbi:hypothetical protein N9B82_06290, partial [Saprospiraceae bacterium]|nr:hypothetical protein [Saprospiraceae bacterium]
LLVEQGGQEIETSFNFNYTHANTISYKKEIGSKKLLLSLSVQGRGAGYEAVIDENLSKENVNTSYDFTQDKVRTLRPYFRIDTKVDYLWGKELRNRIGLDIQNVTNNQNDAYFYFDPLLDNIQKQQQLGIIPILKYTRKFF